MRLRFTHTRPLGPQRSGRRQPGHGESSCQSSTARDCLQPGLRARQPTAHEGLFRVCRVALRALPLHEPTGDHHSTVQAVGDAARILRPPVLVAFTAEKLGVRWVASDSSVACSDARRCSAKSYLPAAEFAHALKEWRWQVVVQVRIEPNQVAEVPAAEMHKSRCSTRCEILRVDRRERRYAWMMTARIVRAKTPRVTRSPLVAAPTQRLDNPRRHHNGRASGSEHQC